jgi:hypothetical protein
MDVARDDEVCSLRNQEGRRWNPARSEVRKTRMKKVYIAMGLVVGVIVAGTAYSLMPVRTYALDQNGCLACHQNTDLTTTIDGRVVSLYVDNEALEDSAHAYIDCTTCHTTKPHSSSSSLNKISMTDLCGQCHEYEHSQFSQSIHGTQLAKGNTDVPDCADCHSPDGSPHSIDAVLSFTSPIYQTNIAQTCGKCHNNPEIMADYGIVENVYSSYVQSIHGRALQLNSDEIARLDVATCVSCHGSHDILSVNNPSSPVAGKENLLKTCQQCHPGAGPQFVAGFVGHAQASPQNIPAAFYAQHFFQVLLIAVLSFGGLIVIAAIIRFAINRWRE